MLHIHRIPIVFAIVCIGLSACAPQNPPLPAGEGTGVRETPTPTQPSSTETFTPSPVPTLTPEPTANPETAYYQSLTDEQKALFDQTRDMTVEGFTRQFLTEQGLTNYLAYYDKSGEVAYVWNFEQGKLNPALKIENNLLINETSASHIIWNPNLNRAEAQKTLADYFRYARARVIAGANHVQLGKTLESALANPLTQKYLGNGSFVTLHGVSWNNKFHPYSVPKQRINVSGDTSFVIKFVAEPNDKMAFRWLAADPEVYSGWGFEQNNDRIFFEYFNQGAEDIATDKELKDMILVRRIAFMFQSFFYRAAGHSSMAGEVDTITANEIFHTENYSDLPDSLVYFSKNR